MDQLQRTNVCKPWGSGAHTLIRAQRGKSFGQRPRKQRVLLRQVATVMILVHVVGSKKATQPEKHSFIYLFYLQFDYLLQFIHQAWFFSHALRHAQLSSIGSRMHQQDT